ncbi:MAG: class I SAM-dependent RNA methyltransferase [Candidatus Dormibacteria bacterium]
MSVSSPEVAPLRSGARRVVRCERMVHGGLCLAHSDGATLMVDGGIPDELVEVVLTFSKGRTWFCRVESVREASPDRVAPPCPYVAECGGCQLQHVGHQRQLLLKREVVVDALRRAGVAAPEPRLHPMADPWRYRWRGEFHVIPGERGLSDATLGFNRARSWRKVAVDDCLIHHPTISGSLSRLRELVRSGGEPGLSVLHVTVGESGDELLLRAKPAAALARAAVDEMAASLPELARWSTDLTTLHWRGRAFRASPESFIQVSWGHLDALYGCVLDGLGDLRGRRVVDAYAGIGVLSAVIAGEAREVVCIESNRSAARMGRLNARINEVADRMRYVVAPVEDALPEVAAQGPVDALILDPPRAGCGGRVTGWLALAGPPRVVCVSCDPATLARDLHVLVASGPYAIDSVDVVDLFPQTYHVETVVALRRQG